jgi:DNA repair exonuclease SbcCD nuclease subunit
MTETRVLHTGDTHIGYRQYGSDERRRDFIDAFERVVEDAVDGEYDALVHAGDLFHSRNPRLGDLRETVALFERLDSAGVEALAVVGNHESKRDAQWVDLLQDLGLVTRLGRDPVVVDDAAFYGVDHTPASRVSEFEYDFEPSSEEVKHNVLVLHGLFEPFPFGEWSLEEFVNEASVDWDAFMLGDYHHPERAEVDGAVAAYCGSTERASVDEEEARGYNAFEFDGDGDGVRMERRAIETREFVTVEVELIEGGTEEVVERTRERDVEDTVVVVEVTGESEAPVVQSEVEEAILDRGALVARVNDRRETEEDEDTEVTFADPDTAVRERVEEMELSDAGREIDALVRGDDVARTNLAEEVEETAEEALETDADEKKSHDDRTEGEGKRTERQDDPEEDETDTEGSKNRPEEQKPEQSTVEDWS